VKEVLLATHNPHKLSEFRLALAKLDLLVLSVDDLDLGELNVEETGESFAQNAVLKARAFHEASGLLTLADDSGLMVDALGGAPGVHSARYGGPSLDSIGTCRLVLDRLRGVPWERRLAKFVCCIAVCRKNAEPTIVEGCVSGVITFEPKGDSGFGYDPIFFYPPLESTFAQLSVDDKALHSHRGRALSKIADVLTGSP
jgi:XTP/dITP diphosphohydrolase